MTTTREQLNQWITEPESTNLEFKEAKSSYRFDKLLEYCVALANEGGGKIILGVTDRRPRRIVGTGAFTEPGRTEAGLYDRLSHRIPIEEMQTDEGRVLVVHVREGFFLWQDAIWNSKKSVLIALAIITQISAFTALLCGSWFNRNIYP